MSTLTTLPHDLKELVAGKLPPHALFFLKFSSYELYRAFRKDTGPDAFPNTFPAEVVVDILQIDAWQIAQFNSRLREVPKINTAELMSALLHQPRFELPLWRIVAEMLSSPNGWEATRNFLYYYPGSYVKWLTDIVLMAEPSDSEIIRALEFLPLLHQQPTIGVRLGHKMPIPTSLELAKAIVAGLSTPRLARLGILRLLEIFAGWQARKCPKCEFYYGQVCTVTHKLICDCIGCPLSPYAPGMVSCPPPHPYVRVTYTHIWGSDDQENAARWAMYLFYSEVPRADRHAWSDIAPFIKHLRNFNVTKKQWNSTTPIVVV